MRKERSKYYGGTVEDFQKFLADGYVPIEYKDCNLNGHEWWINRDCEHIVHLTDKKAYKGKDYEVVWSVWTYNPETSKNYLGYHIVNVGFSALLHQVVASTFLDSPRAWETDVHHIDLNKNNNHFSNLRWMSHREHIKLHKKLEKEKNYA